MLTSSNELRLIDFRPSVDEAVVIYGKHAKVLGLMIEQFDLPNVAVVYIGDSSSEEAIHDLFNAPSTSGLLVVFTSRIDEIGRTVQFLSANRRIIRSIFAHSVKGRTFIKKIYPTDERFRIDGKQLTDVANILMGT